MRSQSVANHALHPGDKPRCLILDDEPLARKGLAADLTAIGLVEVAGLATDAAEALQKMAAQPVDLLFLDLEFDSSDPSPAHTGKTANSQPAGPAPAPGHPASAPAGLRLLAALPVKPLVVLVTAYPQYALAGYDHGVIDYLVKPVSMQRLRLACEKAVEQISLRRNGIEPHLYLKCNGAFERIPIADILYIEAANNYILVHTPNKRRLVYQSLKAIGQQLPPAAFIQIHKSYLVARRHVQRLDGNYIIIGAASLPLSRRFKTSVLAAMQLTNNTRPFE